MHNGSATGRTGGGYLLPKTAEQRLEAREDYALHKVPAHWKKSPFSLAMVLSGAVWSVFAFALGGTLALAYGFWVAMIALTLGAIIGTIIAIQMTEVSARYGIDIDLVSRGSGYGFLGSATTSLIWGGAFLMYAGFEASFMASAVHTQWPGISLTLLYVIMSLIIVPLNWYGFILNDLFQRITWPLFLIGLVWLMVKAFGLKQQIGFSAGTVSLSALAAAMAAVITSATTQGMLVGDWSRFMRKADIPHAKWIAAIVTIWLTYIVEGGLGALMTLFTKQANPGIYAATLLGVGGVLWIMVTQLRINNMNYYSASLALANFSSRVLRWVPGRHIWVVITALITIGTTTGGILNHLTNVLTIVGVFLVAWIGTLLADMLVLKPRLGVGVPYIEHRRGYLANWGWPAIASLVCACLVGSILNLAKIPDGNWGPFLGEVVAFAIGFVGTVLVTLAVKDRWRLVVREPLWVDDATTSDEALERPGNFLQCGVCKRSYIKQDMVTCPVVATSVICSVCCAAHRTCRDVCKAPDKPFRVSDEEVLAVQLRAPETAKSRTVDV